MAESPLPPNGGPRSNPGSALNTPATGTEKGFGEDLGETAEQENKFQRAIAAWRSTANTIHRMSAV
jgi:hypothetical protein